MNTTPTRFDFSDLEIVGTLDMIGSVMAQAVRGEKVPGEIILSSMMLLRGIRDDLAARSNLPTRSLFNDPSFLAECEIRRLQDEGIFDRDQPLSDEEGA